jgi:hypothetical protein
MWNFVCHINKRRDAEGIEGAEKTFGHGGVKGDKWRLEKKA